MAERQPKHGSAQALLPLEEICGDVLCLRGGEYRAVLEAGSVNFALKSAAEQEAILAGYRALLNGLTYPIQVLVRVVPTDIERYLAALREGPTPSAALTRLALDHEAFVRRLARQRTLLERRFYVVVPAGGAATGVPSTFPSWRQRRARDRGHGQAQAAQQLALRCGELIGRFSGFGVSARRLDGEELAALWYAALAGERTRLQPPVHASGPFAVLTRSDGGVRHGR